MVREWVSHCVMATGGKEEEGKPKSMEFRPTLLFGSSAGKWSSVCAESDRPRMQATVQADSRDT